MSRVETAEFVGCVAGNLRAAARVATRAYDSALRHAGLRITQVAILAQVRALQPVTVAGLAAALASERSAIARDLRILEHAGLVSTTVKADDRRARQIRLTSEGDARLRACAPAWRDAQRAITDALGKHRIDELIRLANDLVATLGTSQPGGRRA